MLNYSTIMRGTAHWSYDGLIGPMTHRSYDPFVLRPIGPTAHLPYGP